MYRGSTRELAHGFAPQAAHAAVLESAEAAGSWEEVFAQAGPWRLLSMLGPGEG
jgi:hypothetical protein